MKKVYAALPVLIALSFQAPGQSLVPQNATPYLQGDENTLLEAHVEIFNAGSSALDVIAERVQNNIAPNHQSYFCWGITCYGPGTSIAPSEPIGAGTSNTSFRGYVAPNGSAGLSRVTYCFYDQANIQDSICLEFTYDFTAVGIHENAGEASFLSEPSPNPVANFTLISYRLSKPAADVRIILNNMLGAVVQEMRMDGRQNHFLLNTSAMQPGLYFYSLVADNQVIQTKKLVVADKN